MTEIDKYGVEWYKKIEEDNTKLRSKLLKNIIRNKNETAQNWLARINMLYIEQKR